MSGFEITGNVSSFVNKLDKALNILDENRRTPVVEKIVDNARQTADVRFQMGVMSTERHNVYGATHMDEFPDVSKHKIPNGFEIVATGQDVPFIEFGTGVHYNNGEYPIDKPEGIVGIGQYGDNNGNLDTWAFYKDGIRDKENLIFTHGNPAFMPMYHAREEVKNNIIRGFTK